MISPESPIPSEETALRVGANLRRVGARLFDALRRAGRGPGEARLCAVTKYATLEEALALRQAGQRLMAESKIPDCFAKIDALPADIEWHFIGHLQRNKAQKVVGRFAMVHSVDSVRLMERLAELAEREKTTVRALLEFNVAGEEQKHGFAPGEAADALAAALRLRERGLLVEGLMGMAPYADDAERARPHFALLRGLRDQMRLDSRGALPLPELSMGMSGDFEVAVEEGSTLVRVGSSLFE